MLSNSVQLQKAYHRRFQVSNLYCQGRPQHLIAEDLGVSAGTIYSDLRFLRKMWLESSLRSFDQRRSEELAKIDTMEKECWEAWQKSKEDAVMEFNGQRMVKKQTGDVGYLRQVAWCIEMRVKMFGLLKEVTQTNIFINWDSFALGTSADLPDPVEARLIAERGYTNGQTTNGSSTI